MSDVDDLMTTNHMFSLGQNTLKVSDEALKDPTKSIKYV
jgi:hypothetical protein